MKLPRKRIIIAAALLSGAAALCLPRLCAPPLSGRIPLSRELLDRHGALLRFTLSSDDKYRHWLPLSALSPTLVQATLLQEDRHFRAHPGVNPASIARAFYRTYLRRGRRIGGSTLTMQLARIMYRINSKTPSGKLAQMARAVQLELSYSKNDILEAYLNLAPYGGNVEGAGAAARIYFGKDAAELTLQEAFTLCVIPKSPGLRSLKGQPSAELVKAREALFSQWLARHPEDRDKAPLVSAPMQLDTPGSLPVLAPHFTNSVLEEYPSARRARTTLDLPLQTVAERKVATYIRRKREYGIVNAAAMIVDTRDMGVRAVVGSADYADKAISGQVNGTQARRSPGSALKPFIYALAMEQGLIHPMTMLKDTPFSYRGFNPENFDGDFQGPLHARDALVKSRNVPAVFLASKLKSPTLYEFLKKAGVTPLRDEGFYGLALALGGAEISMEKMAELYAMLDNAGKLKPLRKLESEKQPPGTQLLSPEAAYMVLDILKDNPPPAQSFRRDWTAGNIPVRWKTGTSAGFRDAWAIGVAGNYVIAVWVGNFDGRPNPAFIGADAAAPLMFELTDALKGMHLITGRETRPLPMGLTKAEVCAVSGQIPGPHCPVRTHTLFIAGKSPIKKCDIHRQVAVNSVSGMAACSKDKNIVYKVYEFWPSDLLKIFRQAGIPRRLPPPPAPSCTFTGAATGRAPAITSPQAGVTYTISADGKSAEKIALSAVTDSDAATLYWFIDADYIGAVPAGQAAFWKPKPGSFTVRTVDDRGRADSRKITVSISQ